MIKFNDDSPNDLNNNVQNDHIVDTTSSNANNNNVASSIFPRKSMLAFLYSVGLLIVFFMVSDVEDIVTLGTSATATRSKSKKNLQTTNDSISHTIISGNTSTAALRASNRNNNNTIISASTIEKNDNAPIPSTTPVPVPVSTNTEKEISTATPSPTALVAASSSSTTSSTTLNQANEVSKTNNAITISKSSGMYITIDHHGEGMASWRIQVCELLVAAKTIGFAKLVEPCVLRGRLTGCGVLRPEQRIFLGDLFDLTLLKHDYGDQWIGYNDFVTATGYEAITDNEEETHDDQEVISLENYTVFRYRGGNPRNINWQEATTLAESGKIAIFNPTGWGKHGFGRKTGVRVHGQSKRLAAGNPEALADRYLAKFHPHQEETVWQLLAEYNVTRDTRFGVIAWRPEKPNINFMACAESILQTRDHLMLEHGIEPEHFFLVSALSENKNFGWGPLNTRLGNTVGATPAVEALHHLYDHDILRLEHVFPPNVTDGSYASIWDFILVQLATTFSICSGGPRGKPNSKCYKCNYCGKSAQFALQVRANRQPNSTSTTYDYWP